MAYYSKIMNKKGIFKPFNENKIKDLVRFETWHFTKWGLEIVKFYNYKHPEKWFFYRAGSKNLWFTHFIQCRNYL